MRRATDVGFTLVERIAQWEREYGANIAVRDRETTYTYTELFDAARRFASCLASEGIEAGDRIVLQLPNKAKSLIILFGSVMRGCIPVLALPTHRKAEISHFCSKSNASCLIVPCSSPAYDYESLAKAIKKDNPRLKCFVIGSSDQYRSVSDMRGELWQATAPHSSSILFLLPSGGTTGLPKLIPRSNFSYVYNFVEAASRSLFSEKTKYLAALSICHNLPLACPGALGALEKGGTVMKVDFGINVLDNKMYHIFSSTNVVINDTWVRVNFFSQLTNRPTIYAKFFGELQGGIADRSHVNCWQAGCLARRPHIQHLSICWLRQNTIFLHPQRNAVSLRKYSSRCKCKTTSW